MHPKLNRYLSFLYLLKKFSCLTAPQTGLSPLSFKSRESKHSLRLVKVALMLMYCACLTRVVRLTAAIDCFK